MAGSRIEDTFSWASSLSRTRLSSVAGFGISATRDLDVATDIAGVLRTVRELNVDYIPYSNLRRIDEVGEGTTFSVVTHFWGDRIVALKYIKQPTSCDATSQKALRKRMRCVQQEILITQHKPLAAHPHILDLLGYGWQQSNGNLSPYLVVEYGALGTLRQVLDLRRPWNLRSKLILAGDVAAGLMALHMADVIHGDLKLDNIVCFSNPSRPSECCAKLCDFGHSIAAIPTAQSIYYYGTPRYLPPEAFDQATNPITASMLHKCDIWTFGLALWEIFLDGDHYCHARPMNFIPPGLPSTPRGISSVSGTSDFQFVTKSEVFGNLDLSRLHELAQSAVDALTKPRSFERSYLRPLMRKTLNPDPTSRLSDLSKSPIIRDWQKAAPASALMSKLAFHTQSSHFTFDMFRPDKQADIPWSTQTQILQDLRGAVDSSPTAQEQASSCLQLAICYTMGFGCPRDLVKASHYFGISLQHDTNMTSFIRTQIAETLMESMTDYEQNACTSYMKRLVVMLAGIWRVDSTSCVSIKKRRRILPTYEDALNLDESASNKDDLVTMTSMTASASLSNFLDLAASLTLLEGHSLVMETSLYLDSQCLLISWLDLAILNGDTTFFRQCLQWLSTDDLNVVNQWNLTPLILACCKGRYDMVQLLLARGADPEICTSDGCNILHFLFCLQDEAVHMLEFLVSSFPELKYKLESCCSRSYSPHVQWPTVICGSPLAMAVSAKHNTLVSAFVHYGASPTSPAFCRETTTAESRALEPEWTPVHLAVRLNLVDILEELLQEYQSPWTAFHALNFPLASALSFTSMLERVGIHGRCAPQMLTATIELIDYSLIRMADPEGRTPFWQAIDFENYEVAHALLESHGDLAKIPFQKPTDSREFTPPLHFAVAISARKDSPDALLIPQLILGKSPQALHRCDHNGWTILHCAVRSEYTTMTTWVLELGSEIDSVDSCGRTPLMLCQSQQNTAVLLSRHANVQRRDNQGRNAAFYAVERGDDESLYLLLEKGIDINSTDIEGQTLLHAAVIALSASCVEGLCRKGAKLQSRDTRGNTPLHYAIFATPGIVQTLLQHGASVTMKDQKGRSPVQLVILRFLEPLSDRAYTAQIFEAILRPLRATLNDETHNRDLLLDILYGCVQLNVGGAVLAFFASLGPGTHVSSNIVHENKTALHVAVEHMSFDAAQVLLEKCRASPDAVDANGDTPLMALCQSRHGDDKLVKFIDLLLSHSPDLRKQSKAKLTTWQTALAYESYFVMERMLSRLLLYEMAYYKNSRQDALAVLRESPVEEVHLHNALAQGHISFVRTFLHQSSRFPDDYMTDWLNQMARAMKCRPNWPTVSSRLSDLVNDAPRFIQAIAGQSVEDDPPPPDMGLTVEQSDELSRSKSRDSIVTTVVGLNQEGIFLRPVVLSRQTTEFGSREPDQQL